MPMYCYTDKEGLTVERRYAMSEDIPERITVAGVVFNRDIQAEHRSMRGGERGWPRFSEAMGVMPDQVPDATRQLQAAGVRSVEFNSDGDLKVDSPQHQRQLARALGMKDRGDYFG